jgi:long-chain acyl-CoA synthetase
MGILAHEQTVVGRFQAQASRRGSARAMSTFGAGDGGALTWLQWYRQSEAVAAALLDLGIAPGAAVAIWAGNRTLWPVADLGALMAGAVPVGLFPTAAPAQVQQIVDDCGASILLVDTEARAVVARAAAPRPPVTDAATSSPALRVIAEAGGGWEGFLARGRAALDRPAVREALGARLASLGPDTDAILIYTSGSTGVPKGARLTHRALLAAGESLREALALTPTDRTLSFLPYCHAAERIFGLYTRIVVGIETLLVEDHQAIWDAARSFHPTVFGGLPRFFEKVHEVLDRRARESSEIEQARWREVLELGRQRRSFRAVGAEVPPALEAAWRRAGEGILNLPGDLFFGASLRVATSGGATLPHKVASDLDALGVTVLGAYGLTEHLCATMNRPHDFALDASGCAMPGSEIQIAPDGEILLRRSAHTFAGYLNNPEATAAAFTPDGVWLRTGDLGALDARGFLRVVGRKKELLALSTGKKVAPLPMEARLRANPWIEQAVVLGEGRKFVSALLVPSAAALDHTPGRAGDLHDLLARAIDEVNADLSRPEQIRSFAILPRALTVEAGELTPTLKLRREVIEATYGHLLDARPTEEVSS